MAQLSAELIGKIIATCESRGDRKIALGRRLAVKRCFMCLERAGEELGEKENRNAHLLGLGLWMILFLTSSTVVILFVPKNMNT